jgi:hypothetical protein
MQVHSLPATACLFAAVALFPAASVFAQQSAADQAAKQGARVSLGSIKGMPGTSIMLPFTLTADPENPLRSLAVDLEYVSNSLQFQKASPGLGAELAGAKIEASLTEGKPDDKNVKRAKLRITASLPEPPPKEGLPGGVLAYLMFQIAEEAKPFAVRVTPTIISAEDLSTPPKKLARVATEPGQVAIEDPQAMYDRLVPQVACFFFTH